MNKYLKRYIVIFVILFVVIVAIVARLTLLQIIKGEYYKEQSMWRSHQTVTLTAPRGGIYDRNGKPIVTNQAGYTVSFKRMTGMDDTEINRIIVEVTQIIEKNDGDILSDLLPISDTTPYTFSESMTEAQIASWREEMKLGERTAAEIVQYYKEQFNVSDDYTQAQVRLIVGVRYDMLIRGFSATTAFTIASDVSLKTVTQLREQGELYAGISIETEPVRKYLYGSTAAHILGYVGQMNQSEYEFYKEKGYKPNEYIGKQGVEKAFEDELHGIDGSSVIERNRTGKNLSVLSSTPALPGNNVYLTLDLDVQMAGEKALKETIDKIYTNALDTATTKGLDVGGGSFAAVSVKTGEVLALGSYPTFDLNFFRENYIKWSEDPMRPLFNRAMMGTYPPGSTFKMITAAAALEEKTTYAYESIRDEVVYYLGTYSYRCMANHEDVNMEKAIGYSCNYYFYEMGNRMGMEPIWKYADMFGLGKITGIELLGEEARGVIASPEGKEARGDHWYPGHTLQMAIGQDDTLCTPLQLACYTAQLANKGVRYTPTLLKNIRTYDTKELVRENTPLVRDVASVSESTFNEIHKGMRMSATEGTGSGTFKDYEIPVACKTGSAEVYTGSDNGIFVAFAPYDDPEIAVAVIVEHAGSGSSVGPVVKAIIDAYLNPKTETEPAYRKNTLTP